MNSLQELSRIPIKNIYYMLCYAWGHLNEKDLANISREDEKDIYHLLIRILVDKLRTLISKGFYKEYKSENEEMSLLRGKILFSESVKSFSFNRGKMHCDYDELSTNILHNQIIKTTLNYLLKVKDLDSQFLEGIKQLYPYFSQVDVIKLNDAVFSKAKIFRSNHHYGFVLLICKYLYESLLLNEEEAVTTFIDFWREPKKMARLFEDFVRNFYKKELLGFQVKRDRFYWDAEGEELSYLPIMETDISLENKDIKWIIDTKFYQNTLYENYGRRKLISTNLYQLFAYLNNFKDTSWQGKKELRGMLLYPQVGEELSLSYVIKGYPVKVATVDLNSGWKDIHNRLLGIVGEH